MPREKLSKGDLEVFDGQDHRRLPVGPDGTVLTAKASEDLGMEFAASAAGDVVGPASATNNAIVRFDGTTGKLIQNSEFTIDDSTGLIKRSGQITLDAFDGTQKTAVIIKNSDGTFRADLDVEGQITLGIALAITQGGTGQTTKSNAFNNLAPNISKGDLVVHNGADNVRLPVGNNGEVIVAKSGAASGIAWKKRIARVGPLTIINPVSGDKLNLFWANEACKVIEVYDICEGGTSVAFDVFIRPRTSPYSGGSKVVTAGFSATPTGNATTSFDVDAITEDDWLVLVLGTVVGSVTEVNISLEVELT